MGIAVITGASSGMGREFARRLAGEPEIEAVWAIARRADRLEELREELGEKIVPLVLDLQEPASISVLSERLQAARMQVDALVCSSGYGIIGAFDEGELSEQAGMVRLNCEALVAVTHVVLSHMGKGGRVIHLASSAAFMPQPGFAIYAASKSFVLSFSKATARELRGRHISVTAVCPGPVKTEFFDLAERHEAIATYKAMAMADPVKVVDKALRDAAAGKKLSVYGGLMKAFHVAAKIFPHNWLLPFVR